jgi:hypothetical protein
VEKSIFCGPLINEVEIMYMKHLNHNAIVGLLLVAFASAAFAESEQLHEQQLIQSHEHMPLIKEYKKENRTVAAL